MGDGERTEKRAISHPQLGHSHLCAECGDRWGCMDRCLETCGCLGRPYCPHRRCQRCRSVAGEVIYHQPVVGGGGL
jgi:hypothetical protein